MAIANVVVADATTPTPVNHTFVPVQDGKNARWVNDAGAQTIKGQEVLTLDIKRAAANGTPSSARVYTLDPKEVANSDGTYKVDHKCECATDFKCDASATRQERLDSLTLHINTLIALKTAMVDFQPQL